MGTDSKCTQCASDNPRRVPHERTMSSTIATTPLRCSKLPAVAALTQPKHVGWSPRPRVMLAPVLARRDIIGRGDRAPSTLLCSSERHDVHVTLRLGIGNDSVGDLRCNSSSATAASSFTSDDDEAEDERDDAEERLRKKDVEKKTDEKTKETFEALLKVRGRQDLLDEWASPSSPSTYHFPGDHLFKPVPWTCGACGGSWSTSLHHRLRRKDQGTCPHCGGDRCS